MRDEGWLLFRQDQKPLDTRKHEGTVAVKESARAGALMDWSCLATTENA